MSEGKSTYDIVIVFDQGLGEKTHTYEKRDINTAKSVMDGMYQDKVFGLFDDEFNMTFFRPNQITKLQINLRESWTR